MNGMNSATEFAKPQPASPCDEAHAQLQMELGEHEGLIDRLVTRLAIAMCDPIPPAGAVGPALVDDPVRSELHGRLLGTVKRVRQQNTALREILDRLTI